MRSRFVTGAEMCNVCHCIYVERANVAIDKELIEVMGCSVSGH